MTRIAVAVLIIAIQSASLPGQAAADFSGTWTMDEKRSGSATHEAFVGPVIWVIAQTPDKLVLERRLGPNVSSFIYAIKGKPPAAAPEPVAPAAEAPGQRAYWDGSRLILETQHEIQGKTVTTREALVLSSGGQELVAERVLEVEHGYTLKGAQNFSAVKDFFAKRAP